MTQILNPQAGGYAAAITPLKTSYRIDSIDLLRGLVMIIMALDHTRDFFHAEAMVADPLNLTTTTPALFFTRWITHFCAPVFVFLAGTSAFFQKARKTKKDLSGFLISRGLWLVVIEVVVINFAFSFNPDYSLIGLQTIWAIGISMILLGVFIWLPYPVIFALGLIIILGHNSLDFYEDGKPRGSFSVLYSLLHVQGFFPLGENRNLLVMYPFLSWTGLMLCGYSFGKLFSMYEGVQRRKVLTWLGLGVIGFFIVLRATNIYGNPEDWTTQKNAFYTFLSFIDTHKYPPSLLYMSMTIGPAILFIAWVGNTKTALAKFITVYGRVPFFYYVLHFFLIHLLSTIAFVARGHSLSEPTPQDLG
ncbi:MAG: heparan-alpha-glucosaminide N-acetyltransferase domain-containing protein, partial [Bacteroidota bacterium]